VGHRIVRVPHAQIATLQSIGDLGRETTGHIDSSHDSRLNGPHTATDNILEMWFRVLSALLAVALITACGQVPASIGNDPHQPVIEALADLPPLGSPMVDSRPVWAGFEATHGIGDGLVAHAIDAIDVFASPGEAEPELTLEPTTILGTTTVLGVIGGPVDGWLEVMLPIRPNGSTGWVRSDDVRTYIADSELIIDLSERTLVYVVDGTEVLRTDVGIGSRHNPTPVGRFFVTDSVTLSDPGSPWGPHALGLSARSDTITSFNGGDGIIGIHGTNNPSSIGGNVSLGCVRLPNEMITALHRIVPVGTRVTIDA